MINDINCMVNDILGLYLRLGYHFIRLVKCNYSVQENEIKIIIRGDKLTIYYKFGGIDWRIDLEGDVR